MPSDKCAIIIQSLDNDVKDQICQKSSIRSLVGCMATRKRQKEGKSFGDAMRESWKEAKEYCAEYR